MKHSFLEIQYKQRLLDKKSFTFLNNMFEELLSDGIKTVKDIKFSLCRP
jgi:hypothetical protein